MEFTEKEQAIIAEKDRKLAASAQGIKDFKERLIMAEKAGEAFKNFIDIAGTGGLLYEATRSRIPKLVTYGFRGDAEKVIAERFWTKVSLPKDFWYLNLEDF